MVAQQCPLQLTNMRRRLKYRDSLEQDCTSQDSEVLKNTKGTPKTKVSGAYKLFKQALIWTKEDGYVKFFLEDIDREEVKKKYKALRNSFDNI